MRSERLEELYKEHFGKNYLLKSRNSLPPIVKNKVKSDSSPETYFSAMDELGEKLGFTYRYVPNRNAGYEFDRSKIAFVKK